MSNNTNFQLRPIMYLLGLILFFTLCTWVRTALLPYDSYTLDFIVEIFQITAGVFTVQYVLDLLSDIFSKKD
jgi:hypothetical protein